MLRKFLTSSLVILCMSISAQKITISGIITDTSSGESLVNATIYHPKSMQGSVSNEYGFYSFTLEKGQQEILISYLGYNTKRIMFDLANDTVINFELESNLVLSEVTIRDNSPMATVRSPQMSTIKLNVEDISTIPVIFGEADVLKTLQLLPGVSAGQEGFSGIYVRGGGPDQNLFLLDGVPVYSTSHMLGLFSVFNNDAIKSVDLIKGGYPARYGGRLSSVVDIRMKEGDMHEFHGEGSIGLISSKLMIEGPIIKDKTSFMVSGRRTYYDVLMAPFIAKQNRDNEGENMDLSLYFYDLNAKINHKFSDKDRLYLSGYFGRDIFKLGFTEKYDNQNDYNNSDPYLNEQEQAPLQTNESTTGLKFLWGNITTAARWNHVFSNKLFSNATLTYSDYKFETGVSASDKETRGEEISESQFGLSYLSKIVDYGLKYDLDYIPNNDHFIRFGTSITEHLFSPGIASIYSKSNDDEAPIDTAVGKKNTPAEEFFLYAEDQWTISPKLMVNAGLHYSAFHTEDTYYHSLQPRISARYLAFNNLSLKASYVRMTQYLNLLASSTMNLPTDLWIPATSKIKPQRSWQAAIGSAFSLKNSYQFELEGFYKKMNNLVEYKEGASFFSFDENMDDKITQGTGASYGLEFLVKKTSGTLTGWLGYTLSKSDRQFEGKDGFEPLNAGRSFPFKYDRRHDLSLVLTQKYTDKWDFGLVWVFSTGNAFTLKDESFTDITSTGINGTINSYNMDYYTGMARTEYFSSRNNYRMPNYHRLDLSANYHFKSKHLSHTLSVGVYNTYVHQNAMFVFADEDYDYNTEEYKTVIKQISLLNFLPFFRYGFKF